MRLPISGHTSRPWRIHDLVPDFDVEDVWRFRTPGAGPDDFPLMMDALRVAGGLDRNTPLVKLLFAIRWRLGALLGWDDPSQGVAARVESLVTRLPPDLQQDCTGTAWPNTPFTMLYTLQDECALELANKTVHDVLHAGWVENEKGEYELHMAALVRPNGRLGRLYMAGIKPIRYAIVYPALTRQWERAWLRRDTLGPAGRSRPGTPGPR